MRIALSMVLFAFLSSCTGSGSGTSPDALGAGDATRSDTLMPLPDTGPGADRTTPPSDVRVLPDGLGPNPDITNVPVDAGPPHVLPCDQLGAVGEWQAITPPPIVASSSHSTLALALDPHNAGTLYLGSVYAGFFKSTNCGSDWTLANNGPLGTGFDRGMEGSMVIDPVDSNVVYIDNRYGFGGIFKSTDGGATWRQTFSDAEMHTFINGGQVEWIAMDPTDHLHVIATPHFSCETPAHSEHCMLETTDGGDTWTAIENAPGEGELDGVFMVNRTTWLWPQFDGMKRTTDQGRTWQTVYSGGTTAALYHGADGMYYVPAVFEGMVRSSDTTTWTTVSTMISSTVLAASDVTMFASGGLGHNVYSSAPLADPTHWTVIPGPAGAGDGAWMLAHDNQHHILYSSNYGSGAFRMRTQ